MISKVFVSLAVLAVSSVALADAPPAKAFTYRVEMPSLQVTCADHATRVGSDFAQATQLTVTSATCAGTHSVTDPSGVQFSIDTIVVGYEAAAQVQPIRAIYGGSDFIGVPGESSALFDNYAACYSEMGKQIPVFEKETALLAVAAHCDAPSLEGETGYSLVIEGFGAPKAGLYVYTQPGANILPNPSRDNPEMKSAQNAITASGGQIAFTDASRVFYYAAYELSIFSKQMATFNVASQCTDQLAVATTIMNSEKLDGVTVACLPTYPNDSQHMTLSVVASGTDMMNAITSSDRYASFADCMSDKARAIANVTTNGYNVPGAICRPADNENQFVLDIYEQVQ